MRGRFLCRGMDYFEKCSYISKVFHSYHVIVLSKSSIQPNMDAQQISKEYTLSKSSLILLSSQQDLSAYHLGCPADTSNRPVSTRGNNRITVTEEGIYPKPPWTLPQKRSNRGLTSGGVGDPEESHPRGYSAKRLKGPITPSPSPRSSYKKIPTIELSRSCLDFSGANTALQERADPAEAISDHLDSERPKTLRSPFEYMQVLVTSQVDPPANDEVQQFNSSRPVRSDNPSGYIYYAPTNLSDKTNYAHRRVPRRQLSYGDPPSKPGPRSLHKTPGSWGLRHEAERHAEEYDLDSWSDSTSNASAARTYHSEPIRSKPRLWLDLSEQKDKIQEAHAITIRTSPSKPQVICTPRRRAAINSFKPTTPVCLDRGLSFPYSHTPPPTPASLESVVGLGLESVVDWKYDEAYERIKAKATWTQTPPSSNPSSTGTVQRVPPETSPPVRADTPRPTTPVQPPLSELTSWIIAELEASFASIPQVKLQLDSPVILQICLPAGHPRVPRKSPPTLPLSRYSNFNGPLSSHPIHSPFKFPLEAASPQILPIPSTCISLPIIFPQAPSRLLSSLQATYLALHYISMIPLPPPSSDSAPFPFIKTRSPLSPNMSYIPAKARAMLGLQTPTTRPSLPASWRRPETRGWKERIEDLEYKLRSEVVRFIRMCEGSELGKNDALVRAVGQVVKFGQEDVRRAS